MNAYNFRTKIQGEKMQKNKFLQGRFLKKLTLASLLGFSLSSSLISAEITQVINGFASPESVYVTKEHIFITNVGAKLDTLAKDNDGFISKLDKKGEVLERQFIKNLNAPKGMAKIQNTLYVVDIDTLKGFDLGTSKEIFSIRIEGSAFLNDIALFDENTLFISDTATGIIYKISLESKKVENFIILDLAQNGGANGLAFDYEKQRLLVACYHPDGVSGGQILSIDIKSKEIELLIGQKSAFDGIVLDKNGDIFVSDWGENLQGSIYKIIAKDRLQRLDLPYMQGPADMFLDGDFLYIPKMAENELIKLKIR